MYVICDFDNEAAHSWCFLNFTNETNFNAFNGWLLVKHICTLQTLSVVSQLYYSWETCFSVTK